MRRCGGGAASAYVYRVRDCGGVVDGVDADQTLGCDLVVLGCLGC